MMSNRGNPAGGEELPDISLERVKAELSPYYRVTDKQFDISRKIGSRLIGLDLIKTEGDRSRIYLTYGSSVMAENLVKKKLGNVLLQPTDRPEQVQQQVQTYEVPEGAKWLLRTLQHSPYRPRYMERLARRAADLLREIREVDAHLFGVSLSSVVVGHSSETPQDDTVLLIAPPLSAPNSASSAPQRIPAEISSMDPHLGEVFIAEYYGQGAGNEG